MGRDVPSEGADGPKRTGYNVGLPDTSNDAIVTGVKRVVRGGLHRIEATPKKGFMANRVDLDAMISREDLAGSEELHVMDLIKKFSAII